MYLLSRWYTRKARTVFADTREATTHVKHTGAHRAVSLVLLWTPDFERIRKRELAAAKMTITFIKPSQLIAAGILANMEGKLGIAAWRW